MILRGQASGMTCHWVRTKEEYTDIREKRISNTYIYAYIDTYLFYVNVSRQVHNATKNGRHRWKVSFHKKGDFGLFIV